MNLPIIASLLSTMGFGIFAIVFSRREEKARIELAERERKQKQRTYEVSILKEIQERIGYSLDIGTVIDVITGSLKNLFPYSVASSLLFYDQRLVFKSYVEESVDHDFIKAVEQQMVDALHGYSHFALPTRIHESLSGIVLDDTQKKKIASTFTIPFEVNQKIVGVINISSTKEALYSEEEIAILYQITSQASHALSKLQSLLTLEKGKLMATIGSLADGVFMVTSRSELFVINDAAKRFLNLQQSVNPSFIELVNALSTYPDFGKKIEEAMLEQKSITEKEIVIHNRVLQVFITPVLSPSTLGIAPDDMNEHGTIGVSVLLHDITLEKNLEQMKKDFTNMVVHELRAPLTAVKNAAKMLSHGYEDMQDDERKQLLSLMEEQSQKLLSQVSGILDAAKLEEGRFTINKAPGDIAKVAHEVILIFKAQADMKHIKLQSNIAEDVPTFAFDSGYIGQVMNNLLSNSLKFTPENGTIMLTVKKDQENVLLMVSDTGMGIPKEKQATLFSKFMQVSHTAPTPTDKPELAHSGTGLGLYIVKGIVQAHGGTINLQSEPDHGTTITVSLPIVETTKPQVAPTQQPPSDKPTALMHPSSLKN